MITGEDIDRCRQEKQGMKLVVVNTAQYFEFEIPATMDVEEFINSDECRAKCAVSILNQTTDLELDRVYTQYDEGSESWVS